ncbi:MAG TPA: DegT/DnrJ/EryC1/StrS family aminotransferase [Candidatus Methylomirabilis sp.]|nr:DegT/DnrJ/EryC1/StrS family aminotransferase [Candidatus Methylomirabilis sp.]
MSDAKRQDVPTGLPALLGGTPVRARMLPYGRQDVTEADIQTMVEVLRGDWLTNGPTVARFEEALAARVGARFAVALSSGTAALHAAAAVAGLGPADEVILSPLTTFSFHPVKHITTGEGGMVTTGDAELSGRLRRFRNHGIDREVRQRQATWRQDRVAFGFNYRLTDIQSALGMSQLGRLDASLERREEMSAQYHQALQDMPELTTAPLRPGTRHARHFYPLRLNPDRLREDRETIFQVLRAENIGVSVHYLPVHLHPYYQERFGTGRGLCPAAETAADRLLTLPLFSQMTDGDVGDVIAAVRKVVRWARV